MKTYSPRRGRLKGPNDFNSEITKHDIKKENKAITKQKAIRKTRALRNNKKMEDKNVDGPYEMENISSKGKVSDKEKTKEAKRQIPNKKLLQSKLEEGNDETDKTSDGEESESDHSMSVPTRTKKRVAKKQKETTPIQRRSSSRNAKEPFPDKTNEISLRNSKFDKGLNDKPVVTSDSENEIPVKLKVSTPTRQSRSRRSRQPPLHALLPESKQGKHIHSQK